MLVVILTFFAISILTVSAGIYVFVFFYNKRTRKASDRFIQQTHELTPIVFHNIKLCYWITNGPKSGGYPNNHCDLYLFDNWLAIIRTRDFIFKVYFAPLLITSDVAATKNICNIPDIYKPDRITFKQIVKGEVDIKLTDPVYTHYTIDITLKGLTIEQTTLLEKIRTWS